MQDLTLFNDTANAPKVVAYDKLMDTHNNISVKEFGKIIGIG